jgi:hypothetical protein
MARRFRSRSAASARLPKLYQHRYDAREENRDGSEEDASRMRHQFAPLLLSFGVGRDIGR